MDKLLYSLLAAPFAAAGLFSCEETPTAMTDFSPTDFSGTWFLTQSTNHHASKVGCALLHVSQQSSDKLQTSLSETNMFSWNLFVKGTQTADYYELDTSASGVLK